MTATRPPRARPRPATTMARTRRQPPWRPQRWGRPLAVGLTLVLVAALMPGAHADDGGVPISPESVGDQALDGEMFAETLAQKFDAETPVVSDGDDDGGGDGSSDQVAPAQGGEATGTEGSATSEAGPQPSAAPVVEEHPEAPVVQAHPGHTDEQPVEGEDQVGQGEQHSSDSGGCASGCSAKPPNPGGPTVAAAGGWWGRAYDNAATPMHLAARDLDAAERLAREAQASQGQARNPYVSQAQGYLDQVDERIRELGPQTELSETERLRLEDLRGRGEAVRQELRSESSAMSMVQLDTPASGQPSTKDQPVVPDAVRDPSLGDKDKELATENLGHAPPQIGDTSIPGLRPPKGSTRLDGYPAVDPVPSMTHQRSGAASQAVAGSQATSSSAGEAVTTAAPGLGVAAGGSVGSCGRSGAS
jgi:hypothetical protein